jgi:hypothetical protein
VIGRRAFLLAALFAAGCRAKPTGTAGTGAKERAFEFFDAIRRRDWPAAFAATHPNGRLNLSAEAFTRLAKQYRRSIGFEPEQVFVTACDEQAESATAHIVYVGHAALKQRHKDGITLRRDGEGWGVMLPANFGR